MSDFERALKIVLRHEGGDVDHPNDKGGATSRGVTAATYAAYRKRKNKPLQPVMQMTGEELREIYREGYWDPAHCDELFWPVNLLVFDCAVNSGPKQAIKQLQQAMGLTDDGNWGPKTAGAALAHQVAIPALVADLLRARERFFRAIVAGNASQAVFLKGWLNRVESLRQECEKPAPKPTEPAPATVPVEVNGVRLKTAGRLLDGVTWAPLRELCEALGADVTRGSDGAVRVTGKAGG